VFIERRHVSERWRSAMRIRLRTWPKYRFLPHPIALPPLKVEKLGSAIYGPAKNATGV
jgi:hypothetical protein